MKPRFLIGLLLGLLPLSAAADCTGRDLIAALSGPARAALEAEAEVPFATGNLFTATRGADRLLLVGTYHLDDPRFDAMEAALQAPLAAAETLMVEMAPAEEAAYRAHLGAHPEVIFDQAGPSLQAQLGPQDWEALTKAVASRGTPPAAVVRMRPWVVAGILDMPPCPGLSSRGLDRRLIAAAMARGQPVVSLEPFDTALKTLATLPQADQLDMLRQALATEAMAEDLATTLSAAYFRGENRLFMAYLRHAAIETLGLPRAEVDRQLALIAGPLLDDRNRSWIAPLEAAAARGPTVAAFGALHLSGEAGVLALLQARGWRIAAHAPGATWP